VVMAPVSLPGIDSLTSQISEAFRLPFCCVRRLALWLGLVDLRDLCFVLPLPVCQLEDSQSEGHGRFAVAGSIGSEMFGESLALSLDRTGVFQAI